MVMFLLFLSVSVLASGEECISDEDCQGIFICINESCEMPSSSGKTYTEVSVNSYSCVSHEDCVLGEVCDYNTYTCVNIDDAMVGSCLENTDCSEGYSCYHRYCVQEEVESEVSAGITQDNPYFGWVEARVDSIRARVSKDPQTLEKLSREALSEIKQVEQRYENGIISQQKFENSKKTLQERSVQRIGQSYAVFSQQVKEGAVEDYDFQIQQLNSLVGRTESELNTFKSASGNNLQLLQNLDVLKNQLGKVQQAQSSPSYSCTAFSVEGITIEDIYATKTRSNLISFFDVFGNSYQYSAQIDGFLFKGSYVEAYVFGKTYSGQEVRFVKTQNSLATTGKIVSDILTGFAISPNIKQDVGFSEQDEQIFGAFEDPLTSTTPVYYTVFIDQKPVGLVNLAVYGSSLVGFGNSVVYTYGTQIDGAVLLLIDNSIFLTAKSSQVEGCVLSQSSLVSKQSLNSNSTINLSVEWKLGNTLKEKSKLSSKQLSFLRGTLQNKSLAQEEINDTRFITSPIRTIANNKLEQQITEKDTSQISTSISQKTFTPKSVEAPSTALPVQSQPEVQQPQVQQPQVQQPSPLFGQVVSDVDPSDKWQFWNFLLFRN